MCDVGVKSWSLFAIESSGKYTFPSTYSKLSVSAMTVPSTVALACMVVAVKRLRLETGGEVEISFWWNEWTFCLRWYEMKESLFHDDRRRHI